MFWGGSWGLFPECNGEADLDSGCARISQFCFKMARNRKTWSTTKGLQPFVTVEQLFDILYSVLRE